MTSGEVPITAISVMLVLISVYMDVVKADHWSSEGNRDGVSGVGGSSEVGSELWLRRQWPWIDLLAVYIDENISL